MQRILVFSFAGALVLGSRAGHAAEAHPAAALTAPGSPEPPPAPPSPAPAAVAAPAPAPAPAPEADTEPLARDENNRPTASLLSVYLGLDATFWGIEWGDSSENFRGSLGGYDRSTSPFLLKTLEVKFHNLWGIEAGLNYVTDKLAKLGGFGDDDTLATPDDPVSRALTGFLAWKPVDGLTLRSSLTFRRFESHATARGRDDVGGPPLAQSYLPLDGDAVAIAPGQDVTWFSSTRDLAISVSYDFGEPGWDLAYVGYRNIDLVTPTDVFLTNTADSVLVGMHNTCSAVEGGLWLQHVGPPERGWRPHGKAYVLWGAYSGSSSYFDASGGYCFGFGAELGAEYNTDSLSVDFGVRGVKLGMATSPGGDETTLKRNLPIVDLLGSPTTYPAGTPVSVAIDRFEAMGGPYLRLAWAM